MMSGSHSSARGHLYGCLAYLKRGTSVCGNGLRLPLSQVDDAVLSTLVGEVLRPPVAMAVIDGVLEHMTPRSRETDLRHSRTALQTVERELANLATAIAKGGQLDPLLVELRHRQTRRDKLVAVIAAHESAKEFQLDRRAIERQVSSQLDQWRGLLSTKHVQEGRQLLRNTRGTAQVHP